MTHAAPTTINRRTWRQIIIAVLGTALIIVGAIVVESIDDETPTMPDQAEPPSTAIVTRPADLSAYARAHGLAGLSPAGLTRRVDDAVVQSEAIAVHETYGAVARHAVAEGLTGLSPASLTRPAPQ